MIIANLIRRTFTVGAHTKAAMKLVNPLSSAKDSAHRIATANKRYKRDWVALFAEIISCETLRDELSMIDTVDEDELREQAKTKRSFVVFMTELESEFVLYNFYRDYTCLFEKIKDRREDFGDIDWSDTGAVVNYLEQSGFTGLTETKKLLRTAEEEEEADAEAIARRQANAIKKRTIRTIASKQLANRKKKEEEPREEEKEEPREEENEEPREEEEEEPREEEEEEEQPKRKRGRPKKEKKPVVSASASNDLIAELLLNATNTSEDEVEEVEGVEETKGDDEERAAETTVTLPDDVVVLRSRIAQLESFIIGLGKEPPPPPQAALMNRDVAEETIAAMADFKDLDIDPVLNEEESASESESDSESEETSVQLFTHKGVKYYKDSNNQLYTFGDLENAELIGRWNEKTKCIEEIDEED